jgi:predicted dienelactone hydrolase
MASIAAEASRPAYWKLVLLLGAGIACVFVVYAATGLSVLDVCLIVVTLLGAGWWVGARNHWPDALNVVAITALGLALAVRLIEGPRWQLVPWQAAAVSIGAMAGLRLWRPGRSQKWSRVLGRAMLIVLVLSGVLALSVDSSPTLPEPSGPFQVGSEVFRWVDADRPESLTANADDSRQVIAQAWYPSDTSEGHPTTYIEDGALLSIINTLPGAVFSDFDGVDTHATDLVPVSGNREVWPVLVFSPGLWVARQSYTALVTELASRGYVVVAMSHAYDSPAVLFSDGRSADESADPVRGEIPMAQQIDIRAADSMFVLNQLTRLTELEAESPLAGRLDLGHVGIFGHSLGGATAAQVLATDDRFLGGLNIDGRLFGPAPDLDRPFLWLQSGSPVTVGRDELLDGLTAGGGLVTVADSVHMGFSDYPSYFTPTGRRIFGWIGGAGSLPVDSMTPITADIVSAFFGPILDGSSNGDLDGVASLHTVVTIDRWVAPG